MSTTTQTAPTTTAAGPPAEVMEVVQRYLGIVTGYLAFHALALGHRTGLLAAVRQEPGTAADLARRVGTHERSTHEWLCALTAAGFLSHDRGTFSMPAGQAALFEGGVLPFDPTVMLDLIGPVSRVFPQVERSLREGSGVPYAAYQPEFSASQDAFNAPLYDLFLVDDWLRAFDGLTERLESGAVVADIGCGGGRALCQLADRFPASTFIGYDIDDAALELGRERAALAGLRNVSFVRQDVAELEHVADLDVVLAVDAVHDQARPDEVAAVVRRALRPDGWFLLVEPTASGDIDVDAQRPTATMSYCLSLMHCIQVSLAEGGPGLGGMWGTAGARTLLAGAGFSQVEQHDSASDNTIYAARP